MDKLKLELDVLLPLNGECERCVDQLQTSLRQQRGVAEAHVDRAGAVPRLCLHYDPDLVPLAEIERQARAAGAVIQQRYQHRELVVEGMDCADCATKLEQGVGRLDGVLFCSVNFAAATMRVEYDAERLGPEAVHTRVKKMGYDVRAAGVQLAGGGASPATAAGTRSSGLLGRVRSRPRDFLTLLSGLLLLLALAIEAAGVGPEWLTSAVLALSMVVGGYYVFRKGITNLWLTRQLDINFLMTIAALGAAAIGEWAEAALVVFLFSLGETLEGYTMDRARNSIRSLMQLAPPEATLLAVCLDCEEHVGRALPDGTPYTSGACPWCAHETRVPVGDLAVGDRILVKPGERIAMDGQILAGASAVNQAPITGESVPVEKQPGSDVFAGSINGAGALEVEVTRLAADNTIRRIIHMVEEAQAQKAPAQRWIDKFAHYYTPAVVAFAMLVAVVPPLFLGQPFLDPGDGTHGWLYRALALLITACPCALVISIPVSIVSGISRAAQLGVLIKGGAYLEAAGNLNVVAFDKTGTLTRGEPEVTDVVLLRSDAGRSLHSEQELVALAAGIERRSGHPLARAIVRYAEQQAIPPAELHDFRSLTGAGASARLDGHTIQIGSPDLFHAKLGIPLEGAWEDINHLQSEGKTVVILGDEAAPWGLLAIRDNIRPNARTAIAAMHAAGAERVVMLTGDNERTAQAIARELGIDEVYAELKPEDKAAKVRELSERYGHVAMVGDGVNDAPALAEATVGVAMGAAGTDVALETADVALMADNLEKLAYAFNLARRNQRVVNQNLALSAVVIGALVIGAVAGALTLPAAVLAHEISEFVVIASGLRMLRA